MQQSIASSGQSSLKDYYDYIIVGAGAAGLSLLIHFIKSGKFSDKKILVIDKDNKKSNDRTWCFWEKEPGIFDDIIYKRWDYLNFYSENFEKQLDIRPYTYKLIRGIDFYNYCFNEINQQQNIVFIQATIDKISSDENETYVLIEGKKIATQYIFNSVLFSKPQLKSNQYWLLQHFKGWIIKTEQPNFNPEVATLMDFRTNQDRGTAFYYVLPFAPDKALVEYTLFSSQLLSPKEYDDALRSYIQEQLKIDTYSICEEEFGSIPMTNFNFPRRVHNIINIGTAGGQTKGSSGYTFRFIQKHSQLIVEGLVRTNNPLSLTKEKKRHLFYDSILLDVLIHHRLEGRKIFQCLFEKNSVSLVLKFLDNETFLKEDIQIIKSLPTLPFLKAAINQMIT
jgi:lycopene beta-cyclase